MKSTELTMNVANVILILYIAYAIFFIPFNATLISVAIGLITYGTLSSYEAAVSLTLISGIVFALLVKPTAKAVETKEGFSSNTKEITGRIQTMTSAAKARAEPSGIHASSFVEGFADLSGNNASSTATASMTSATPAVATPAVATPPAPATQNDTPPAAGFRSGGTESDSLFKLGVIPEEGKGGFHIDQGTTVINALNALKPDQVKQMTDDTQKLIDTQKNLMSLLSNVKPMMQDGKQMLDTFQQMFGTSMPQGNPLS
jgi:membrane protein implicated in regulation of membrane protease activity